MRTKGKWLVMQPNRPPERPPRVPDVMYGSHQYETTVDEKGETVIRDLGPRILHPWGPKGYQEDWQVNSNVPDKRPYLLEQQAQEEMKQRDAERASRATGNFTEDVEGISEENLS